MRSQAGSSPPVGTTWAPIRSSSAPSSSARSSSAAPSRPSRLLDAATLGGPLQVGDRVRHGPGRVEGGVREPTLDGTGTLRERRSRRRVGRSGPASRLGGRDARLPRRARRRVGRRGGRARPEPGAVRRAARGAPGRAGPPRRCALARDGSSLRLERRRARCRLPGRVLAWAGAPAVSDRARAPGARRHRLRPGGRHPPLPPSCEDRAGRGRMPCCASSREWGTIVTDQPKGQLVAARGRL